MKAVGLIDNRYFFYYSCCDVGIAVAQRAETEFQRE